jgi:competence protein ComEC
LKSGFSSTHRSAWRTGGRWGVLVAGALVACSRPRGTGSAYVPEAEVPASCGDGRAMTVHFYDVGQGQAVLVELPDGRHVLVDTGDEPRRSGCGEACAASSAHLVSSLRADLRGAPIDLLWLTHPHSDHIGGAPLVMEAFPVREYVDDGRDTSRAEVQRARRAAAEHGVAMHVVEPGNAQVPLASSPDLRFRAVVPGAWPPACAHDPNECSIGLRIDDCASSVLLLGDAEHEEEALLDPGGPVTLLQVAHHGSETSTSPAFLSRARPRYAVISAGKAGEGMNREYCHPRAIVVRRLSRVLGGETTRTLTSFDGDRCDRATPADWVAVPASERLWATERDGDVVLTTVGDGIFRPVGAR